MRGNISSLAGSKAAATSSPRGVVDALSEAIDRGKTAEAVVRPLPAAKVLPLGPFGLKVRITEVGGRPTLFEGRLLHLLDLAVEMR